jgi:hypothetical protein
MGGNAGWMAAVIMMDSGRRSGNGQQWLNGLQDSKSIAISNEMAAARWTAHWVVDNPHQRRSSAIGGNMRWTAVATTIDGGNKIVMDGGSGDGQQRRNGQRDGKAIAMGNGMAVAQWTAQSVDSLESRLRSRQTVIYQDPKKGTRERKH